MTMAEFWRERSVLVTGHNACAITRLLDELFMPAATPASKRRKRRLPGTVADERDEEKVVWQR